MLFGPVKLLSMILGEIAGTNFNVNLAELKTLFLQRLAQLVKIVFQEFPYRAVFYQKSGGKYPFF
jgi:hypothetical protein